MGDLDNFPVAGDEFSCRVIMTRDPDLTLEGRTGILPMAGDGDSGRGGMGLDPDKIGAWFWWAGMDTGEQQKDDTGAEKAGD